MTCGGCVKHVTKALQSIPGVTPVDVDLGGRGAGSARTGFAMGQKKGNVSDTFPF
jgi:copper chaperone CopZ